MKRDLPKKLLRLLQSKWGMIRHGAVTFVVGMAFLLAISFMDGQPRARYISEDTLNLEIDPAAPDDDRGLAPDPEDADEAAPAGADPEADPAPQPAQPEAAAPAPPVWREYTVSRNDTMGEILRKITEDEEAIGFLVLQKAKSYRRIRPGKVIRYRIEDGRLAELVYKTSPEYYLRFLNDADGMRLTEDAPDLDATEVRKSAVIVSSLYGAMDDAKVGGNAIDGLIVALETHIDFHRDLRKGDRFEMVYDELRDAEGELVSTTRPKAFFASNKGRDIVGVYSPDAGGYYTPAGESLQRAFLRSPLKFSRVSSKYNLNRLHPVLKVRRPHRGVDYAAPRGTPVRASGDGQVEFAGKKGGYGNVIYLKHYKIYTTVYGHLNRFAKGIRKGARVVQGQVIGYVGSTGLSTGPHLHYEFRVRGEHKDPLSAAVPVQLPPLEGEDLAAFKRFAAPQLAKLELYEPEEVALQN